MPDHSPDSLPDRSPDHCANQSPPGTAGQPCVRVLGNVAAAEGNPLVRLWNDAAARAGIEIRPLSWRTVRATPAPDWVHLQWPERLLRPGFYVGPAWGLGHLLLQCAVVRARGGRVAVTAHNVWSHERLHPWWERVLWALLPLVVTDVHVFSKAGSAEFLAAHRGLRRKRLHVLAHGTYRPVLPPVLSRRAAREQLGMDESATVFATFGLLKRYKGVEEVVAAFAGVEDPAARLLVLGAVKDAGLRAELETAAAADSRIRAELRFLPDDELATYLCASDVVVLPYRKILNSGSAMLALSADRKVLVPDTPTMREISQRVGEGWVQLLCGRVDAAALLTAVQTVPHGAVPDTTWAEWEVLQGELAALFAPQHGQQRRSDRIDTPAASGSAA